MSGYNHANEDFDRLAETALEYTQVCKGADAGRESIDPATWLRIELQKGWPSCGGHSLSSALEYLIWLITGEVVQLSRMFAWVESQRMSRKPSPNDGVTIWNSVRVAKELGLPLENLAQYRVGDWYDSFDDEVYEDAATRRVESHYRMRSVEDIRDFIDSGMGPVLCGVPFDFKRGAWHAIPILHVTPKGKFKGPNSWPKSVDRDGPKDGWFEWTESELDKYLRTKKTTFYGISDLATPQVRGGAWIDSGVLG